MTQALFEASIEVPEATGNTYAMDVTIHGDPTFRHVATGEVLHGQVGPWQEAWQLYLNPSGLLSRKGKVTVYDAGMGCGAQLLATYETFQNNRDLLEMTVVSFDLEKAGLHLLRAHIHEFPYAVPYEALLDAMLASDTVELLVDGRVFRWQFVRGDFRETIKTPGLPKADLVYYDFFSPASQPWLWTLAVLEPLFRACSHEAKFITYASATCVRALLAASGFHVGLGIPSGRKKNSTMAAMRFEDLEEPLLPGWKKTFLTSHRPFTEAASQEEQDEIRVKVVTHPQFCR